MQYFQDSSKSFFITDMNGCLNFRTVHNGADIGDSHYRYCENRAYSWSHNDARNAIWALQPTDYSDGTIFNFFQKSPNQEACPQGCPTPFAVDVNYLAQF